MIGLLTMRGICCGLCLIFPLISFEGVHSPMSDIEGQPISRVKDSSAPTAREREHMIVVDVPKTVRAGEPFQIHVNMPNHPMSASHHIASLRVYIDQELITYTTLAPLWQRPEMTYTLTLSHGETLDVIAECNLDGLWGQAAHLTILPSVAAEMTPSSAAAPAAITPTATTAPGGMTPAAAASAPSAGK